MDRRNAIRTLAGLGVGSVVFQRSIAAMVQDGQEITPKMIADAEWVAGVKLSEEDRKKTAQALGRSAARIAELRNVPLSNDVAPAVHFKTLAADPDGPIDLNRTPTWTESNQPDRPDDDEKLAYLTVAQLGKLIKSKQVSSLELTKLYLARLKKYNEILNCVVTLTEDLAIRQAKQADAEIAAGRYRGPLHGIPWGAKDLISVPGYATTWGAPQYKDQKLAYTATVAKRLEEAGAVLVAKLSLGAIAMGDRWFGGMTRCPWNDNVGSSGSSAGSASAAVAGLVGFAIGSETLGSIISPSRRCGATGLRPTFGRVSRYGCMALSWTMDKIGPITRSVEDCALVFAAIHGADGKDPTAESRQFAWPPKSDLSHLTVGYVKGRTDFSARDDIAILKKLGVKLLEVELPRRIPTRAVTTVLDVEAAAAFDELTRADNLEGLNAWPTIFRQASFISAVDYVRAMRVRQLLQKDFESLMGKVDILINANDIVHTNLTGHPSIAIPVGFRQRDGMPMPYSSILTGRLNRETDLLALAKAYQDQLDTHRKRPPLESLLQKKKEDALNGSEKKNN